jgi:hypothetical protein
MTTAADYYNGQHNHNHGGLLLWMPPNATTTKQPPKQQLATNNNDDKVDDFDPMTNRITTAKEVNTIDTITIPVLVTAAHNNRTAKTTTTTTTTTAPIISGTSSSHHKQPKSSSELFLHNATTTTRIISPPGFHQDSTPRLQEETDEDNKKRVGQSNPNPNATTTNTNKPYFILHVGPPKTATTTLQCGLEELSEELAQKDSYYYVGKLCPGSSRKKDTNPSTNTTLNGHHLMMTLLQGKNTSRGYKDLQSKMEWHLRQGNNMILSLEAMSSHLKDRTKVWRVFLPLFQGWRVRIVVGYRHYFDWIPSMYFQNHAGPKYKRWSHEKNGQVQPSFYDYLDQHLETWDKRKDASDFSYDADVWSLGQHLTLASFQKFAKHFEDVMIFNLHQQGDPVTNFVCQMLPTARNGNVCQMLLTQQQNHDHDHDRKHHHNTTSQQRMSHSYDADRLAYYAYEKGILPKGIPKLEVVKQIVDRMKEEEEKESSSPLDNKLFSCLPRAVEAQFLNASLSFERAILSELHRHTNMPQKIEMHQNMSDHISLFHQAKVKGKYCEIDPAKVLMDDSWRKFLSEIVLHKQKKNDILKA